MNPVRHPRGKHGVRLFLAAFVVLLLAIGVVSKRLSRTREQGSEVILSQAVAPTSKTAAAVPSAPSFPLLSAGETQNTSTAQVNATPPPAQEGALPEREIIGSEWKSESFREFAAFADWTGRYLSNASNPALVAEGMTLAKTRRDVLAKLIELDPRRALMSAVPFAVRDQLPAEIQDLLEKRVSGFGDLYRISSYQGDAMQKPYFDYAKVGDDYYNAFRYGARASLFELKSSSILGIAVGKSLAVLDSPVSVAEVGQKLEGVPINEVCLYSGNTVVSPGQGTVETKETAPLRIGDQWLALCSPAHATFVENALKSLDATGLPTSAGNGVDLASLTERVKEPMKPWAYGGAAGTGWPNQPSTNLTYGHKRAIIYRVQMQNWTAFPSTYTEAYCTNTIIGNQCSICYGGQLSKTVSNQLYEFSWGKVIITQAVVTPVLMLPKTRDQYTNDYFGPVLADAKTAAQQLGIATNYDFAVIVHSGLQSSTLNACAWGGGGAVWVNECWSVGVLVHEFGHVFGLPHANGWDITDFDTWSPTRTHEEYKDLTDPMGTGNGSQRNHYNSFFKYYMRWYPANLVTSVSNSGTYRVYQFDDINAPLTNNFALIIKHDANSSYWVSLRGNTTSGNFANAAQIQEVQNSKNDTHLMDFNTPDSNNSNGGLTVGQSYYDPIANITLKTVAIGGTAPQRYMDFAVVVGDTPLMVAHYGLEGDARDDSGFGNHGTLNGNTAFAPGRIHAQALSLDGTGGFAEIPRSISNDFTVSLWLRTTNNGAAGTWRTGSGLVNGVVATGSNDFGLSLAGNKVSFGVGNPDTAVSSLGAVTNGQWHHVAATRSGVSGEIRLYVDGVLQGFTTGPTALRAAPRALRIGGLESGSGFLNGIVDDVRFFNYTLSASSIAAMAAMPSTPHVAGTLYVDLHASPVTVGSTVWTNQGTLGNFTKINSASLSTNVANSGVPGVSFNGLGDAYQGPNSVTDLDGSSDRSIEVWAFNPSLLTEETTVSWGHRGNTRRNMGFNFGSDAGFGAATHYGDDVGWGTPPTSNAWHHLVYTCQSNLAQVYVDGVLRTTETLGGTLNTWPGEPINLACQRSTANGSRVNYFSGSLNTVRIHGGVLSASQVFANYLYGMWLPSAAPATPPGLVASARNRQVRLDWDDASGGASAYVVKRATNSGGPYTTISANVTATSFTDTNVSNGVMYYYVISSANLYGQSANSLEVAATAMVSPQPFSAGTLYVDLRASDPSAGSTLWLNQGTLGDFAEIGAPVLAANVGGVPGVSFNGTSDAYLGPLAVTDLDGGSDRSIEVWAYNPGLSSEETMVSLGHRDSTRREVALNFGNNTSYGAATHYGDDLAWGIPPAAGAWHHLVYTYSTNYVSLYVDGVLRTNKTLGAALDTFPGEAINLACQRGSDASRSQWFSGYLNAVRVHGGVLTAQQVQSNYFFGPWKTNSAPVLAAVSNKSIIAGATVIVTNSATDANSTQQTLSYSLLDSPVGALFGVTNGVFQWRARMSDIATTNRVIVRVADNGAPVLSATQSFNIAVVSPNPPVLTPALEADTLQLSVSGDNGPDYTILASTNAMDWTTIFSTNSPALPFTISDPGYTNLDQRFYRAVLGP